MSCDQRLCPGVGGRWCEAFMPPIFRDPHPTCAKCRGVGCTADMTCDICKDWSVVQWETFLKRTSGSALSPVSQTPPLRLLQRPDALRFPLGHSLLLLKGMTARGGGGCPPRGFSRGPPSLFPSVEGRMGGGGVGTVRALASVGADDSATSSLPGEGVAGSSRSQESFVLADPDLVASSSSPKGDRRSRSGGRRDSTRDRSRSRSSRLSPPRGRAFREEHRCAHSRSRGGS